jgi:hypothetical protein
MKLKTRYASLTILQASTAPALRLVSCLRIYPLVLHCAEPIINLIGIVSPLRTVFR